MANNEKLELLINKWTVAFLDSVVLMSCSQRSVNHGSTLRRGWLDPLAKRLLDSVGNLLCSMVAWFNGGNVRVALWISTDHSQVNHTNPSQTGFLADNVIEQAQRSSRHGGQIWNAVVNRLLVPVSRVQLPFQSISIVLLDEEKTWFLALTGVHKGWDVCKLPSSL